MRINATRTDFAVLTVNGDEFQCRGHLEVGDDIENVPFRNLNDLVYEVKDILETRPARGTWKVTPFHYRAICTPILRKVFDKKTATIKEEPCGK